jgi:uncharacterized protein YkwD
MTNLQRAPRRRLAPRRHLGALAGAALAVVLLVPTATPTARAASIVTVADAESALLRLLNVDRREAGLVPLRLDAGLARIAGARSDDMVRNGYFGHTEPDGDTFVDYLADARVTWYAAAETIASDRYPGLDYSMGVTRWGWMNSPSHRAIVLSDEYNYVGLGLAVSSVGQHRWTAVFARLPDSTGGWVDPGSPSLSSASAGRRTATIPFRAWDTRLQRLTAGLRDVEIQRRVDGGAWDSLGWTTGTSTRRSLAVGRRYEFRFRARDLRGNVGAWSDIVTVRP